MKYTLILFLIFISYSNAQKNDSSSFWSSGIVLGTPARINFLMSNHLSEYGYRISFGFSGIQGDIFQEFERIENFYTSAGIKFGYSRESKDLELFQSSHSSIIDCFYFGLSFQLSWYGIYFQTGPVIGTGNYSKLKLNGQLGYVYEFR